MQTESMMKEEYHFPNGLLQFNQNWI